MERTRSLSVVIAIVLLASASAATSVHLRCEYLENPLGIDAASPHLSWQNDSTERDWKQIAYEILVASSDENLRAGKADIWDSGKVDSSESVGIAYHGPAHHCAVGVGHIAGKLKKLGQLLEMECVKVC